MIPLPCHWSARPQLAYLSDNRMENDFMDGSFLIGARAVTRDDTFRAIDPATNEALDPAFATSSLDDVAEACHLAADAFDTYRETDPETRAAFLEAIADEIEAVDGLIERAVRETGLPQGRITGERGRTTGQLRLFAKLLRQGRWAGVVVDNALPEDRKSTRLNSSH